MSGKETAGTSPRSSRSKKPTAAQAAAEQAEAIADLRTELGSLTDALDELRTELKLQRVLLEIIASSAARTMQIADKEHSLRFADRQQAMAPDVHGLRGLVEKSLTDLAMHRGLHTTADGAAGDGNPGQD